MRSRSTRQSRRPPLLLGRWRRGVTNIEVSDEICEPDVTFVGPRGFAEIMALRTSTSATIPTNNGAQNSTKPQPNPGIAPPVHVMVVPEHHDRFPICLIRCCPQVWLPVRPPPSSTSVRNSRSQPMSRRRVTAARTKADRPATPAIIPNHDAAPTNRASIPARDIGVGAATRWPLPSTQISTRSPTLASGSSLSVSV